MENINAKVQYLKGMANGINMLDGDKFLLVEEIINTLEVMAEESARISERMQKEIEKLQSLEFDVRDGYAGRTISRPTNYDYFDDITAPFPYKSQTKTADVWYDDSLSDRNYLKPQAIAPVEKENLKIERICKHCGSYVTCDVAGEELGSMRIQCPKCKRFLLPYETNELDNIAQDLGGQMESIDNLETSPLGRDFASRLRANAKNFNWELSEEVFSDDSIDEQYNLHSIIRDIEDKAHKPEVEPYTPGAKEKNGDRVHVDHETKHYVKPSFDEGWPRQGKDESFDTTQEVQYAATPWGAASEPSSKARMEERPLNTYWQLTEERPPQPRYEEVQPKAHHWDIQESRPANHGWKAPEERPKEQPHWQTKEPRPEHRPVNPSWGAPESQPVRCDMQAANVNMLNHDWQTEEARYAQPRVEEASVRTSWHEEEQPHPKEAEPKPTNTPKAGAWQYYDERPAQLRFEEAKAQAEAAEAEPNHDWKLQQAKWQRPRSDEAEPSHEWSLKEEKWEKPKSEEPELNHDWQLNKEKRFKTRTEEAHLRHEWQFKEEEEAGPELQDRMVVTEPEEPQGVRQLEQEIVRDVVQDAVHELVQEAAQDAVQEEVKQAATAPVMKAEQAPEPLPEPEEPEVTRPLEKIEEETELEEPLVEAPHQPDWADEAETQAKTSPAPQASAAPEPVPAEVPKADEAGEEDEGGFDWNADFELSIDKILSMDKKDKPQTEGANGISDSLTKAANTGAKFNDDSFGKFKYSFEKEDELDRQRNKVAPNYNIDKKVLKNFSFLGYASELAKKNN